MNLTSLFLVTAGVDYIKIRIVSSVAVILLWSQMFLWFRLFDSLAQYVDLIFETVKDIRHFMTVLGAIMFMFQCAFYMIEINRLTLPEGAQEPVYEVSTDDSSLFGAGIFNQYMLLLGDINSMVL